jgi:hypothetical protein
MSKEYAESRIRKALEDSHGHPLKAQQKIIAEAAQDHRLLLSLTHGHLTGIVALWVNRVMTRKSDDQPAPDIPSGLDMPPEAFGKEILKALKGQDTAYFGRENSAPAPKRRKASQQHIDALRMMAKKNSSK